MGHITGFEPDCPGCDMAKARPHEALSYTWGTERSQEIALLPTGERAYITANCAIALRALRYKSGPTILWVDAICIDQSNVVERSTQIGLMSRIYKLATQLIIYVGEEDRNSRMAMDYMKKNKAKMDEVCNNRFSELNIPFTTPTLLEVKAIQFPEAAVVR